MSNGLFAHWTGWDAKTKRFVTTGSENRIFLVKSSSSGTFSVDEVFKDDNGKPHGVVFSR